MTKEFVDLSKYRKDGKWWVRKKLSEEEADALYDKVMDTLLHTYPLIAYDDIRGVLWELLGMTYFIECKEREWTTKKVKQEFDHYLEENLMIVGAIQKKREDGKRKWKKRKGI